MKLDVKFSQSNENIPATFQSENTGIKADFGNFVTIHDGQNGATFTPSVSADGVISWTNDRDLTNPDPVNIKGAKGDKGDKGEQGERGLQGIQGIQGVKGDKGDKGADGTNGKDGYTPVKGVDYFDGVDGKNGQDGRDGADGVGIENVALNGNNLVITLTNGTVIDLGNIKGADGKDGVDGKDGKNGEDGKTPVKGVDYFTDSDISQIVSQVIAQLPKYNGEVVAV